MNSSHPSEESVTAELVASAALQAVKATEQQLDAELARYNIHDADDLEGLRRRRIAELKARRDAEVVWRRNGHGTYTELADQKEWFEAAKVSERLVTHFFRSTTWRCEILDKHFTSLAPKHLETRFVKIDAEKCPFLAERLSIVLMPSIIVTKNNFTHDRIEGFDELGGVDTFPTVTLERRLAKNGAIEFDEAQMHADAMLAEKSKIRAATKSNPTGKAIYGVRRMIDSDEDGSESD